MQTVETEVNCPFCGESFTIVVDLSVEDQSYIEDCYVCCKPVEFSILCEDGELQSVDVGRG